MSSSVAVREIRLALLGFGTIGRAVALAAPAYGVQCVSALVQHPERHAASAGLTLERDGSRILDADVDVIVEALGGVEPARTLVAAALERGIPVVTANKSLLAAHGPELRARAALAGVPLLYEAAVVAGVPFVGALTSRAGLRSVTRITGILNGTSHAITTAIERGESFAAALADAQARGYAEPDSSADVSGRDAAEKLAILLQLCGAPNTTAADIERTGIDALTAADFAAARGRGGVIKPMATATLGPNGWTANVGPAFVPSTHLFAGLSGVTNALELQPRVGPPITFVGPGAGPEITAQTILDDVIEAVR
ncbi:MAG: homoserine dehydrogenase [Acidobacteria bacterium]|nr:MAG: homoserine dehydrogenase [Acidobacteriota bacterium]